MGDRLHNIVQTCITTCAGLFITVRNPVDIVSIPVYLRRRGRTAPNGEMNVKKGDNFAMYSEKKIKLV